MSLAVEIKSDSKQKHQKRFNTNVSIMKLTNLKTLWNNAFS